MVPVVALVGRPNVGKSTLFNRLTKSHNNALTNNFPGLTRDRKYGYAQIKEYEFVVIDTCGIDSTTIGNIEKIENCMIEQSQIAIREADIVLFVVDAHVGVMPIDYEIANYLRSQNKIFFVVVNKIDNSAPELAILDFYGLGLDRIYPVTATHGYGINNLLENGLLQYFFSEGIKIKEKKSNNNYMSKNKDKKIKLDNLNLNTLPIKIAIVGRPNVGKSTLINCILGENRVVVYDDPGTTRDSIYIPMQRNNRKYILIDTAGIRKRGKINNLIEKFSIIKTLHAIEDSNVVIFMIDASIGISDKDLSMISYILDSGRSLVIVINKWDIPSSEKKNEIKNNLKFRLKYIDLVQIHFISALKWNIKKDNNLFQSIIEAYENSTNRINTATLTRIMKSAIDSYQPPFVRGRRVKLKYAHAGGYNPLIIVIHGNLVNELPSSYKRYLINYFHAALTLKGTLIHIHFKESKNPYSENNRSLIQNQHRKRKRFTFYSRNKY